MLRKTVLVRALSIAFSAAALSAAVTAPSMAQSNASGNINGTAEAGTTISLLSLDTGLKRSVTPSANGKYTITALPIGRYKVDMVKGGTVVKSSEVEVIAGQGVTASFAADPSIQMVKVSGRLNRIDVSNTNNGATFTARELAALPIAKSVDAIIQLAPNTTRADSRYAGGASFGGGGASENAYYINGFPTTNALTQLGSSELPFGAIAQAQILTGGFGAEFGRSVGGVVNITTKSGTNKWEAGVLASVTPAATRARPMSSYYPRTGAPENNIKGSETDGRLYIDRSQNSRSGSQLGAFVGGPIIKDKLFMFVALERTKDNSNFVSLTSPDGQASTLGWTESAQTTDRYVGKLDFNITDNHRLEFTTIGDTPKTNLYRSGFDYATGKRTGAVLSGEHYSNIATQDGGNGGKTNILRYVGNVTENLTVTAMYGKNTSKHINTFDGYDVNSKLFQSFVFANAHQPGVVYASPQVLSGNLTAVGAQDETKAARLDIEYKLGAHTLRAGLDDNKLSSVNAGEFQAGGGAYTYRFTNPLKPIKLNGQSVLIPGGYYGRESIFQDVTNAYSDQSAQYIEDKWQVTKNLLVTGGLRNEQFSNKNGDREIFMEMKNQIAPRLSVSWDVNGDASTKVYGSLGRYHLQIPTHLAVRGASRSLNTRQYFTYTGVDANGAPIGRTNITTPFSSNNEYNQAKDAKTLSSTTLKPTYQDELTIGLEKQFSPSLNFGVKATYRTLGSTIDDFCDSRPIDAWAVRNKVDTSTYGGFGCANFNPGVANTFLIDFVGDKKKYENVVLTAADLGFEKAKRTYTAIDVFAEHPMRNGWYSRVNYTLSRSKGNTEGQTLSDVAQTDVAATQTWDFPELMVDAYGLLPNNRTHQVKAYGFYELTPQVTLGYNALVASGRPKNCLGNNDPVDSNFGYGSSYHMCNGVVAKRGSEGKLPVDTRLDLNVIYKPAMLAGLALKLDMFNVFDRQTPQTIDETYNSGASVSATYGRVISYTAPRSMRLTAEYNYKF